MTNLNTYIYSDADESFNRDFGIFCSLSDKGAIKTPFEACKLVMYVIN